MRYLSLISKIASVYFKTSLQREIAFRSNFMLSLLNTGISLVISIGSITIIFSKVQEINGWMYYETLTVTGIFLLILNLRNLFFGPSLGMLAGLDGELWRGDFDFVLLKPVPTQLYVSIRSWAPLVLIDLVISIVIICIAVTNAGVRISPQTLAIFFLTVLISLVLLYSLMLILASVAFWWLGTPLLWILDSLYETGRYPVKIYPVIFRNLLTWVLPVGIMVSFPAEALLKKADFPSILISMGLAVTVYSAAVLFFKASIRKYASASS